ncbi:sigma-70 family RNA polymerase sigma factor [Streptomonospora halophila]|uniref:RNA polymerase sigma factor n=1 Tax=Streptomonospora halophila TaxID=427369 RepID=UPI0031E9F2C7
MAGERSRRAGPREAARDPDRFEEFYRRHVERITRFVARRVDDPHTAADLTADVFLAAIRSADSYRPDRGEEEAWLFGIARNVVAAERRRAAREADSGNRLAGRRLLDSDDITRMEERIHAEDRARELLGSMAELPEGERQVLELVAVDQLSVTEAAAALGIRKVTARVRLHRARKALAAAARRGPAAEEPPTGTSPADTAPGADTARAAESTRTGDAPVGISYARGQA